MYIIILIYLYYYHQILKEKYEKKIKELGISNSLIAYRKNNSNIKCFIDSLITINTYKNCICLCFDISGFFDNIDHDNLKKQWCKLLEVDKLPDDHFKIFDSISKYTYIEKEDFYKYFTYTKQNKEINSNGKKAVIKSKSFYKNNNNAEKYQTIFEKFKEIKNNKLNIIKRNNNNYGIPQGTSISGFLSNLSMINFDVSI